MSVVHDRWELVEPLLFAQSLREPQAFLNSPTKRSNDADLAAVKREHRFDEAAIARAFRMTGDAPCNVDAEDLHAHVSSVANRWLTTAGDHWALRVDQRSPGHEIIRWRGVTMLIPPSIVIAGALSSTDRSHPCSVQVLPTTMAPQVPVGHLHVHLGPMLPFEALWGELWNVFLQRRTLDATGGIASIGSEHLPEIGRHTSKREPGKRWQWILELAFAARVWLAHRDATQLPSVLEAFSRGRVEVERRRGALLALWAGTEGRGWSEHARRDARDVARARMRQDRDAEKIRLRTVRRAAERDGRAADPYVPGARAPTHAEDEVVFLASGLRHCRKDERYARVFYQYLRVKVALYRQLVVDPWTTGLRHFLDVVKRDEKYTNVIGNDPRLDRARLDAALAEKPLEIGALEIHARPERWIKRRGRAPSPHGWILSFVRTQLAPNARAKKDPTGPWAAQTWRRAMAQAGATCRLLARCIERRPSVLRDLRGLSLMDWERNGPVHLFERPFRRLLDASAEVASSHPRLGLSPLRTAIHLGEDFDHLLSGLRQIYEPFEWGLIGRGDRIGHALALGCSPEAWCKEFPWVRMRPLDRILDIGFVMWAFEVLGLSLPANTLTRLEVDASNALQLMCGGDRESGALERARDLWRVLPRVPPRTNQGSGPGHDDLVRARELRANILDDRQVGRRALELSLTVETSHDLAVLTAVHEAVMNRVAQSHIAIEINPSSNLLIGGFRSIFQQPAFHGDDLPILLNADDPLTFGTTLADEYAYAWAGMVVGSGAKPHHATRRLEEAARCSMRYAFRANEAPAAVEKPRREP